MSHHSHGYGWGTFYLRKAGCTIKQQMKPSCLIRAVYCIHFNSSASNLRKKTNLSAKWTKGGLFVVVAVLLKVLRQLRSFRSKYLMDNLTSIEKVDFNVLEEFCGSRFWDLNVTWNTDNPDFTKCFKKTILVWFPCGFLWLLSPLKLYYIASSKNKNIPWTLLNVLKFLLMIPLMFVTIFDFYHTMSLDFSGKNVYPVDYSVSIIKLISFLLYVLLLKCNLKKGYRTSGIIFLFWLILVLCESIQLRSSLQSFSLEPSGLTTSFILFMVYYALIVVQLILNCFADAAPKILYYPSVKKPSPEVGASFLSKMLFSWYDSLLWKGFRKSLDMQDLWDISFEDSSKYVVPYFNKYWPKSLKQDNSEHEKNSNKDGREKDPQTRVSKKKPISIVPAICKAFGRTFLFGSILKLFQDILGFTNPQILSALIGFVESDDYYWKGYFYAILMFASSLLQSIFMSQHFYWMLRIGMRMRTALTSAIYRKALRLSNTARRESTVGEIVNLMSIDVHRFVELTLSINLFWSAPFQVSLALYFLWQILGVAAFAGLAVLLLLIPFNVLIAHHVKKLQVKQMKHKDERLKIINEVLNGMKVLKLYAWEPSFENQVKKVRNKELEVLKRSAYLSSEFQLLWTCLPFLVSLATFATFIYINEDNILDSKTAFVSIALFEMLRLPLGMFPAMITNFLQTRVSIQRLNKFMNLEEVDPDKIEHNVDEVDPVIVEKGDFSWEEGKDAILKDINLHVKEGHLVAIVGSVGSGKSSLISALLGEMEKINGRVNIKGTISYVPQQAWIQNVSLRDNILFGNQLKTSAFKRVINACALRPDIGVLPSGVDTEIGEKGINLSGGQKQRVSLARAIYCNADIYLLDDPLSAVDSHVGKHIFENVIGPNGLLKKKTRILVTHGIAFLPEVDEIIVMKEGKIIEKGNYEDLLKRKGAFAEVLINHLQQSLHDNSTQEEDIEEILKTLKNKMENEQYKELSSQISRLSDRRSECSSNNELQESRPTLYRTISGDSAVSEDSIVSQAASKDEVAVEKLIENEKAETGKVKWKVYLLYIKSFGVHLLFATFLSSLTYESFSVGSKFWLSYWSSSQDSSGDAHQRNIFLGIYGGMGIGVALTAYLRDLASRLGCWHAGRNLHTMLLKGVLRAPMSFFDTTPLGRIIARFARDLDGLDSFMPFIISDLINNIFTVLATLFVISYNTPMFLVVVLPIGIIYYFIQQFYLATSRQLKRLESVSRSPIFSHFAESISGAPFIRAFGVQDRFIRENEEKVDKSQMCYYPNIASRRWLSIRLELLGNFVIFFASLFAVMGKQSLTPGAVGLSISNAFLITRILTWLVRTSSELENNIVAAERIKEYGDTEPEAAWETPLPSLPKIWPTEGKVEFKNFQVCYRDGLNMVLKDLTFTVKGGEKIGIVGRTGAGKSSLTLSLFRIIEPAGGKITIDGVDIATLGLHALRGRLTIIPQDPVLFSGTLRMNLDPFDKYSDGEIWAALEHAHLSSFVKSLPAGLQHEVSEEGDNLSVGQRQLICLARALLRKTKVLVLDEATAAVDLETDELIQATIRSEFKDCTIFTIAHRLNTIMDSDRVIVLDKGRMVEYGSPPELLNKKNSLFSRMAKDAGII